MSDPKTYTAKDIERYHRGEMSAAEMHSLEKAALDDPALADMLEGYSFSPTPSADLQILQQRLQQRIEPGKKKSAAVFSLQWMKAAAVILLLAGVGWLVFQTITSQNNVVATIATARPGSAAQKEKGSPVMQADSVSTALQVSPPVFQQDNTRQTNAVAKAEAKTIRPEGREVVATAPAAMPNKTAGQKQMSDNANAITLLKNGRENADSTAGAMALRASAAAPTLPAAPASTDSPKNFATPANRRAAETGDFMSNGKPQMARRQQQVTGDAEPVNGWQAFDQYIVRSRKTPAEEKAKTPVTGEVEISFDVDKEGNPVNITITKPLCNDCDAEAIRLLKEGPKWKGKRGRVTIALFP